MAVVDNVAASEIEKFDAQADAWWDKQGPFKLLHAIGPLRLRFILEATPLANKTVLDVGCGGGLLTEAMAREHALASGIDRSPAAITTAKAHAAENHLNISYHCVSAEDLAEQQPASFDVVTCMEMLEHVPDPASTVAACARLLKPGGHFFASTLNRHPKAYALAIVGAEYLFRWLPRGTHDYAQFITPAELTHSARHAGLQVDRLRGLNYNPLSRNFFLSSDLRVNYLMHAVNNETSL